MSAKRSEIILPSSSRQIREIRRAFQAMPKEKRIDLMVEAGVPTLTQAERAKKKPAELRDKAATLKARGKPTRSESSRLARIDRATS